MLWAIISWFFIGLVVGAVARLLVPGKQSLSFLGTAGLGVAGAFLGGLISWFFTGVPNHGDAGLAWPGWILSVLGAILLLLLIFRRRSP